jgi:hypothetical protein
MHVSGRTEIGQLHRSSRFSHQHISCGDVTVNDALLLNKRQCGAQRCRPSDHQL